MMNAAESIAPSATIQMVSEVHARRQPAPAEQPEPEERRLEEERRQPLDRQRRAEHVADEARVRRPVHAELELLHQPGDHAHRDVDHQQRSEEARQPQVGRGRPRLYQAVCRTAVSRLRPIVTGTKRKW